MLWKHTREFTYEDAGVDKSNANHIVSNSSRITIGLFYKPIQKLIDLYWKTYELRLPKYELNDNFPLNNDGYTVITHLLLLERGRYHSKGPLLINNLNEVKLIAKKQHDLRITIDMYFHKGHDAVIIGKECGKIIIKNTIIQAKWKKQSTNKDAQKVEEK